MLAEVLHDWTKPGEVVCDCTLGETGHTVEIAKLIAPDSLSIGIDQDAMAHQAAARLKQKYQTRVLPLKGNFGDLDELLVSAKSRS